MSVNGFHVNVIGEGIETFKSNVLKVPFGCEYALSLQNNNSRRAVATISIDGENVSQGGFIIPAWQSVTIERSADKAKKFKFVPEQSAEAHAEDKTGNPCNGIITVEFFFERCAPIFDYWKPYIPRAIPYQWLDTSNVYATAQNCSARATSNPNLTSAFANNLSDGCTVEGSASQQQFQTVTFSAESQCAASITFYLKGYHVSKEIKKQKVLAKLSKEERDLLGV